MQKQNTTLLEVLQDKPLPVTNGVITPINGLIGVITLLMIRRLSPLFSYILQQKNEATIKKKKNGRVVERLQELLRFAGEWNSLDGNHQTQAAAIAQTFKALPQTTAETGETVAMVGVSLVLQGGLGAPG